VREIKDAQISNGSTDRHLDQRLEIGSLQITRSRMKLPSLLGESDCTFREEEGASGLAEDEEVGGEGEEADDCLKPEHPAEGA
jgi:hypothetical protein